MITSQRRTVFAAAVLAGALTACTGEPGDVPASPAVESTGAGPTGARNTPPFRPVASNLELMESVIAHAAEEYWESVRVTVEASGTTEYFPETDEEWEEVWAAGLTLAESGNLLLMPPRSLGPRWDELSLALVDAGLEAARAAEARDTDAVFEAGANVYTACLACHEMFITE